MAETHALARPINGTGPCDSIGADTEFDVVRDAYAPNRRLEGSSRGILREPGTEEKYDVRTAGRATGDASVRRNGVYALLLVVAASIVASRILPAPEAFTVNDQSRWSTVRALVDTGSYSIGRRYPSRDVHIEI